MHFYYINIDVEISLIETKKPYNTVFTVSYMVLRTAAVRGTRAVASPAWKKNLLKNIEKPTVNVIN